MSKSVRSKCIAVCVIYLLVTMPSALNASTVSMPTSHPIGPEMAGNVILSGPAMLVTVPDGTSVRLELKSTIVRKDTNVGSRVDFTVVHAVEVDGRTVIERGAPAWGKVTNKKKGRRWWGRPGKLEIALEAVTGVDGGQIPIREKQSKKGGNLVFLVVVRVLAAPLFPIVFLFGLMGAFRGENARIPAGTEVSVSVQGNYEMSLP